MLMYIFHFMAIKIAATMFNKCVGEQMLNAQSWCIYVCFLHPQSPSQNYKNTLQTQVLESVGERYNPVKFGDNLSQKKLNEFQDEQIGQLYELMVEATKSKRQFDIQEDRKWSCRPESGAWTERKQK